MTMTKRGIPCIAIAVSLLDRGLAPKLNRQPRRPRPRSRLRPRPPTNPTRR